MGKSKQTKEKKFNRNVEISAPILDPEIIKAIHSPPKGGRVDIRHGGFKALLSDLNSQDSTDELAPLNDNHVPSYIGISCAVSGYSGYSAYGKKADDSSTEHDQHDGAKQAGRTTPSRSRATSPITRVTHHVNHIVIDKKNIHSADEERKELTEKLTASATERRRSPSPVVPPTEDDRHHGAYVGARYCPLPPPSKVVNKHIPLLGIDDDQNPDELVGEEENKVEQKIASLYGDNFVEDWRESMTHKSKKEIADPQRKEEQQNLKCPKDLVTLKPTPQTAEKVAPKELEIDLPTPSAKVLAGVEKQFLNKLLTDENPPMPKQPPTLSPTPASPIATTREEIRTIETPSPASPIAKTREEIRTIETPSPASPIATTREEIRTIETPSPTQPKPQVQPDSPELPEPRIPSPVDAPQFSPPKSPDSGKSQSIAEEELRHISASQVSVDEQNIEYEIRAQSPLDNQSSPVKVLEEREVSLEPQTEESKLVSLSSDQIVEGQKEPDHPTLDQENNNMNIIQHEVQRYDDEFVEHETLDSILDLGEAEPQPVEERTGTDVKEPIEISESKEHLADGTLINDGAQDGHHYLRLLDMEKDFIRQQINMAESVLVEEESELDEDTVGRIRSAIGKANLLINKKCNQFKELCEANINSNSPSHEQQFATLNDDLAGFWDMLSIQVSDVRKSFEALWLAKANDWQFNDSRQQQQQQQQQQHEDDDSHEGSGSKSSGKPKLSAQKDLERRGRLQEHINQLRRNQAAAKSSAEDLLQSSDEQLPSVEGEQSEMSKSPEEGVEGLPE